MLAVVASVFTHTVSSKSVTDEVGWTGTGLSTELAETSRITRWKTNKVHVYDLFPLQQHLCEISVEVLQDSFDPPIILFGLISNLSH